MVDPLTTRRWLYLAAFAGIAGLTFFVRLLPLSTLPTSWPGPDLMLGLTVAWVLRRPDYLPVLLIAAVFLMEDMLLMRPPGLWTLIVVLATEFLRDRTTLTRDLPFLVEWTLVGALLLVMVIANRLAMAVMVVPQTGLGLTLIQLLATVAVYPLLVAFAQQVLGLHKLGSGNIDVKGRRL